MKRIKFIDSRKWGNLSFLDVLEINNVAFNYDGTILTFPTEKDQERARGMWYHLVGTNQIGAI